MIDLFPEKQFSMKIFREKYHTVWLIGIMCDFFFFELLHLELGFFNP